MMIGHIQHHYNTTRPSLLRITTVIIIAIVVAVVKSSFLSPHLSCHYHFGYYSLRHLTVFFSNAVFGSNSDIKEILHSYEKANNNNEEKCTCETCDKDEGTRFEADESAGAGNKNLVAAEVI